MANIHAIIYSKEDDEDADPKITDDDSE